MYKFDPQLWPILTLEIMISTNLKLHYLKMLPHKFHSFSGPLDFFLFKERILDISDIFLPL